VNAAVTRRDHRRTELAPADVRALWRHMAECYDTRVIHKRDAAEMKVVARVLDALGILDRDRFLATFATTIGRRIYLPFEIGEGDAAALWQQVVLCAHEHEHVVQHDRHGLRYEWSYLTSRAARTRFEAEGYRCHLELDFWRWGTMPSPESLAGKLAAYGCTADDIAVATKMLSIWAVPIRHGAVLGAASRTVIDWLAERVPYIRDVRG
jgi:hypothetical protein